MDQSQRVGHHIIVQGELCYVGLQTNTGRTEMEERVMHRPR